MISKKSVERLVIFRLLMLPPCLPIVVVRLPRLPGSLAIVTLIRPVWTGFGFVAAPGDVEPAFRLVGEASERVAVDRVDRHPLAGGDDADDAVARQRMAAAGEMQGHAGDEAADRHAPCRARCPRQRRARLERDDLVLVLGEAAERRR